MNNKEAIGHYTVLCMVTELIKHGEYANNAYRPEVTLIIENVSRRLMTLEMGSAISHFLNCDDSKMREMSINILLHQINSGKQIYLFVKSRY